MKNPFKDLFKKKNKEEDAPKPGITGAKKKTSFFDKYLKNRSVSLKSVSLIQLFKAYV